MKRTDWSDQAKLLADTLKDLLLREVDNIEKQMKKGKVKKESTSAKTNKHRQN